MKTPQFKFSILLIVALFVVVSCKKKETTAPSTPGTGGVTTGGIVAGGIYGNLQAGYVDVDYGAGVVTRDSSAIATFYESAMSSSVPTNIYAGTVTVNSLPMTYNSPQNYYYEPSHTANMHTLSWTATGSGTVSAFSYSYTPAYPKVATPISLPDTCYKASGISVSLNGISNSNGGAMVYIMQGSTPVYKSLFTATGTVTFTSSDLSGFNVNSPIYIQVFLTNTIQPSVGNVTYQFTSTYTYMKYSYLK